MGRMGTWEVSKELAREETEGAGTTLSPSSSRPSSPDSCFPVAAALNRCFEASLSRVARLGLRLSSPPPTPVTSSRCFFICSLTVGVGSNAVIPLSKNRIFSISFSLEFPVCDGKSASMKG